MTNKKPLDFIPGERDVLVVDPPHTLPKALKAARERARLTQADLAAELGVHVMTISHWERGKTTPTNDTINEIGEILRVSPAMLVYGVDDTDLDSRAIRIDGGFSPNPRYRRRLPPGAYRAVYGYLRAMEGAGASPEQLDEAERVMVDGAYNKLNSRDVRERTEDEMILDIDAAWAFIRDVLRNEGMKLK
jgi:transcriptional regulator with XRE-family HTH domain